MEPSIQYAQTSDGVSIAYWTLGEGTPFVSQAPLLWSHLQLEWQDPALRRWYERLAENRRVIRFDWRGAGLSERKVTDLSGAGHVRDLEAVVDRLRLERFALYGIAANSPMAIAYAAGHPERVTGLILWRPQVRIRPAVPLPDDLIEKDWELYTEALAHALLGWSKGDLAHNWAKFIRQSVEPETWRELLERLQEFDVTTLLPEVRSPALLLARPKVRGFDASGLTAVASRMPDARVVFLEGTQPALEFGDIEETMRVLDEFLADDAGAGPGEPPAFGGLVTILFTDITSSTALAQRLGDAPAQEVRRAHNTVVREALRAHGGSEIKHTGDGIMASFPSASRALECAVAVQCALAERNDPNLQVHVGLNAGEPIAEDQDLFGTSVDLARRICDHAEAGEILASNVVRELAAGKGFLFADRGETEMRGFEDPVRVYELRWRE